MKKILVWALLLRLFVAPFAFHSDLTTMSIWGTYAREFGLRGYYDWLNFGNYARPEYPPLATIIFLLIKYLWQGIFNGLWFLNINIPAFPSNLVTWFDSFGYMFLLKLPAILSDLAIGYLIYKITGSKKVSLYYLFNPAVIYLSAVWGQIEAVVGILALLAVYFVVKKGYLQSTFFVIASLLTKATFLPLMPLIFIQFVKNKIRLSALLVCLVIDFAVISGIGYLFTDHNFTGWVFKGYTDKFLTAGGGALPYINLNAFNFWGVIFGLDRISDKTIMLGFPVSFWAYIVSVIFLIPVLVKFIRNKLDIYSAALLVSFIVFMFMPNMHERYFYPVFVFFPIVLSKFPGLMKTFYISSAIFLINLYHWWWVPRVAPLIFLLDNSVTVWILSLVNLAVFIKLYGSLNSNRQS